MDSKQTKQDTLLAHAAKELGITLIFLWRLVRAKKISSKADRWGVYVSVEEIKEYLRKNKRIAQKNSVSPKKRLRAK